jgi:CheY-like chemotaxis protein
MPVTIVGEAGDGEEALALVRRERPDIVITDLVMPAHDPGPGSAVALWRERPGPADHGYIIVPRRSQRDDERNQLRQPRAGRAASGSRCDGGAAKRGALGYCPPRITPTPSAGLI